MNAPGYRWYLGYRHRGKPDELAESLARYVRNNRLSDTVVSLNLEKRPGREFYFFLGLITDVPHDLGDTDPILHGCPLLRSPVGELLDFDQIKTFVSGELRLTTLGQSIEYRAVQREALDNPFDAARDRPTESKPASNELLWYLSAIGNGNWTTFQRACQALGMSGAGGASSMARTLRILGHLELSPDGRNWSVTPPTVVRSQTKSGELSFLTGARRPSTAGIITAQTRGPDRLEVESADGLTASEIIADQLPEIADLISNYPEVGAVNPNGNRLSRYGLAGFKKEEFRGAHGFYMVETPRDRTIHLLLDSSGKWRSGDWYSLRFFHLAINGLLSAFEYDPSSWRLAIMADQRPPEPFERALVLASGLMPLNDGDWLIYQNISPSLARLVAKKLGAQLCEGAK